MTDGITRKEFYEELRQAEERSRAYIEKSHTSFDVKISNNIGAIQKSVAELKDTFTKHISKEELHQEKMEKLLEGIDFTDLKTALLGYKNWDGFRNFIFGLAKWITILTPIGVFIAWIVKKLNV